MKPQKQIILLFLALLAGNVLGADAAGEKKEELTLMGIMIPVLIAVAGYIAKSGYEILVNRQKRKRKIIEDKLQNFYWPIYIRLKKNKDTYMLLFKGKKKSDVNSTDYIIAHYVEKEVIMKNHEEILEIITKYRHLADTDDQFEQLTDALVKHVTIYRSFLNAGINEYPGVKGDAPYPTGIDNYFFNKTKELQVQWERKTF
jgi:hypothetical protein